MEITKDIKPKTPKELPKKEKVEKEVPKEIIVERIVEVERDRKESGFPFPSLGLIFKLISFALFFGICFIIYIFVARPQGLWGMTVSFLNSDLEVPVYEQPNTLDVVKANVNSQIIRNGENKIIISEKDLTSLGRNNFAQLKDLTAEVKDDSLYLYWIINDEDKDNPLWAVVRFEIDDNGKAKITKVGTNRIGLPQFLNDAISDLVLALLNFDDSEKDPNEIIYKLISLTGNNIEIKRLDLIENQLVITVDANFSII